MASVLTATCISWPPSQDKPSRHGSLPYGTVGSRSMRKEKSMKIKNMRFAAPTDDDSPDWVWKSNKRYDSDIIYYVITE